MNANNHIFKEVNITPAFKKGYRGSNENYRPMNILPVIVKIFEKLLLSKEPCLWIKFFRNMVFGRVVLHNIAR